MMRSLRILLLGFSCVMLLAACAGRVPIENVDTVIMSKGHTVEEVKNAIFEAGQLRKWIMVEDEPGIVTGTYIARDHKAVVRIEYDALKYTIKYVDSASLGAKETVNGMMINHNYNRWIRNLDKDIQVILTKK